MGPIDPVRLRELLHDDIGRGLIPQSPVNGMIIKSFPADRQKVTNLHMHGLANLLRDTFNWFIGISASQAFVVTTFDECVFVVTYISSEQALFSSLFRQRWPTFSVLLNMHTLIDLNAAYTRTQGLNDSSSSNQTPFDILIDLSD
jgi:hypothetical protein